MRRRETHSFIAFLFLTCLLSSCFQQVKNYDANQLISKAEQLEEQGHDTEAVAVWKEVIERRPSNAQYLYRLGRLYSKMGEDEQAISALQKSLQLNPENSDTLVVLGYVYLRTKQITLAKESFQKALTLTPDYPDAKEGLEKIAQLEEKNDQTKRIVVDRDQALKASRLGDDEKAMTLWKEILKLNPDDQQALYYLGVIYRRQNNLETAQSYFEQVLVINPRNSDALYLLGLVQRQLGEKEEALKTFEKLKVVDPEYPGIDLAIERAVAELNLKPETEKKNSQVVS